jgi:hypothetical protein
MKVLDLHCAHQHVFEGWFASEDDYLAQLSKGLVACPVCGDTAVSKKLSAPRLNLGAAASDSATAPQAASSAQALVSGQTEQALQAAWLAVARKILAQTEDVGSKFAQEARKIHYGEVPERGIRGQASPTETQALLEEGIAVLPLPDGLKDPLH